MTQVGPQISNNVFQLNMNAHFQHRYQNSKSLNQVFTVLYCVLNKETLKSPYISVLLKR